MSQSASIHIPTFIFIGGPPLHAGYVTRLFKAEKAGKITFDHIVIIDRDPNCAAAPLVGERVRLAPVSWDEWLAAHLSSCGEGDHLVPYHWAPHVLLDWLSNDVGRAGFSLVRTPHQSDPPARPPVLRDTKAGDLAMSYAEWLCPPACIEPALCPHTRGEKWWSLATELKEADRSFAFPCMHLAYGVGTIPLSAIFGVRDKIHRLASDLAAKGDPYEEIWIGTASHCHALTARARLSKLPPAPVA